MIICAYSIRKLLFPFFLTLLIFTNAGYSQTGVQFDGVNDYVTSGVTPANSILNTPSFTVETWFKRNGVGVPVSTGTGGIAAAIPLITKGTSEAETAAADINYFLGINTVGNVLCADFEEAQLPMGITPGLNHPISGTTAIVNGTWYHAAATYDGIKWQLFLNGNLEAELIVGAGRTPNAAVISPFAMATSIRSNGTTLQGFLNGVLDEARIWNFARSQLQIQTSINSELTSGTGLLGRWGLNDGAGTTAINSIAGSPNGTLINGPTWVTPGAPFNISFIPPNAPTNLVVTPISNTVLQLTWTDNSTDENGFQIERSTTGAGGPFTLLTTVAANTITYDNTGLIAATNYCYRVRAINGGLPSAYTTIECATTMSSGPVTLSFQDGVNSYTGTRDTYTYDVSPATVRGAETTFVQDKNPGNLPPDERKSLLRFDLSSIPSGVTISSATLQFYVDVEGQGFNMHRMLVPWDEATVTYTSIGNRHFAPDNTDAESAVNSNWPGVDNYVGLITVTVPASTIQDWINGTLTNNGWLMIATHADDGQQLRSREHATVGDRPKLTVIYSTSPPNQPINPSPANNAAAPSTSPNICATVSDPNGGNIRVRYFGRPKSQTGKFTLVMLPDTQFYTEVTAGGGSSSTGGTIAMFNAQTTWIANNRALKNIVYVGQLGDCVQNGDLPPAPQPLDAEWIKASNAIATIENPALTGLPEGIPFGICVGNHDQTSAGNPLGTTTYYNQYFGITHFSGRSYYGGHNGTNNDNHYQLFTASGIDFIVICLEYDQTSGFTNPGGALDWAETLVQNNPTRKAIVLTHWVLNENGSFGGQGQAIFDRLKVYPNFLFQHGGHVSSSSGGEAVKTDTYGGRTIYTILTDYQSRTNGGNGLLRYYEFDPALNTMSGKTYSPHTNTFETDANSEFTLPIALTSNPFALLGEVTTTSGNSPCINWPSLAQFTDYEWYVELFDGVNTTTGPVWTFTTPANSPLPVNIISFDASVENNKKVKLTWTTTYERDNSHFEIQRSKDGINFISIASVASRNNSNSLEYYSQYDEQPLKGISFYRLKQMDYDRKTSYTRVEKVKITDPVGGVDIFPNPATGNSFNINITGNIKGTVDVQVIDMSGRLHLQQQFNSGNIITVNHRLQAGTYMIKITGEGLNENKKLVIK